MGYKDCFASKQLALGKASSTLDSELEDGKVDNNKSHFSGFTGLQRGVISVFSATFSATRLYASVIAL